MINVPGEELKDVPGCREETTKEQETQILIRRATDPFSYLEFAFTGTASQAIALHARLAEAFPKPETPIKQPENIQETQSTENPGECDHQDCIAKVAKTTGNRYLLCNVCGAMSFDKNHLYWNTPAQMKTYKESQKE